MTIDPEEQARTALRERLGSGARYDSPSAPLTELGWARRGTAHFARKLNELTDAELAGPSLIPGWSRRHVIAHVAYQARGLARLVEAVRSGKRAETLQESEAQNEDVEFGATLPAHALRYLFKHSEVHLNVEWRDAGEKEWGGTARSLSGNIIALHDTPWLRAREIWLRTVDLENGGSFLDFPVEVVDRMQQEILGHLRARGHLQGVELLATDRVAVCANKTGVLVAAQATDLLRWLSGRGARRLQVRGSLREIPPLWRP